MNKILFDIYKIKFIQNFSKNFGSEVFVLNLYPFREWLYMNLLHLTDLKNPNKKIPVHKKEEKCPTRITENNSGSICHS